MNDVTQRWNQTGTLFDKHLGKGRILVRYALEASHKTEEFRVEIVDLEKIVYGAKEHTALVCLAYRGGVFGNTIGRQDFYCKIYGPKERQSVRPLDVFQLVTERWATLDDPIVIDGKCLWMEPGSFVGCVKPRSDMKGLPTIFPASHTSWVFPFLCLFAGEFSSLVRTKTKVDTQFEIDVLENLIKRFHSFYVNQCLYKAVGRPMD